jgi:hypothetical protein
LEPNAGQVVRVRTGVALFLHPLPQLGDELIDVDGTLCSFLGHAATLHRVEGWSCKRR